MKTKHLFAAVLLAVGAQSNVYAAFPEQPIHVLVGFAAGGATDLATRVVAQSMEEELGQPIVVENRLGASGIIATEVLSNAQADGYTLGACSTSAFTILPTLLSSVKYDPVKDFQPIAQFGIVPYILVASPALNVNTLQDVIDLAKTRKEPLTYASGGVGSSSQMAGELFAASTGIKMVHVPYKGLAQAVTDVVAGRVDFAFDQEASAGANIRAGKLKAIAIASAERSVTLPDVPTFTQAGFPLEVAQWIGICSPDGLPQERIAQIQNSVEKAVHAPAVSERFQQLGIQPTFRDAAAFTKAIDEDRAQWSKLIKDANISLE